MNVGELLSAHPRFAFDVEEYVLSTRHAAELRARRARCRDALRHGTATPYRRRVLAALGAGDWNALPLIGKADLRSRHHDFVRTVEGDRWIKTTTGSTGPPIEIHYGGTFYFDLLLSVVKAGIAAGMTDLAGPRGVFAMTISDLAHLGEHVFADPAGEAGLLVHVIVDASRPETLEEALALAARLGIRCISSKPSLLEMLCALGPPPGWQPELVVSGGAQLSPALRATIARRLGTRTLDVYGMTEVGVIAVSCEAGAWHIDASSCEVEIVHGEIVVSSIDNEAMPLVRYRTGDAGALGTGDCACGAASPRLAELSGRRMRCFRAAGGVLFAPTYFNDLFTRFPGLHEFQLSQLEEDVYELRADCAPDDLERIAGWISAAIPGQPRVSGVLATFPPDSKFQRYRTCFDD